MITLKEKYIEERSQFWQCAPVDQLMRAARDFGIRYEDGMRVSKLIELITVNEWFAKTGRSDWDVQGNTFKDDYPPTDVAGYKWNGDFVNMDSGPQLLDPEFRPTPLLLGKMRQHLWEQFGSVIDTVDIGELGTDTAKKYSASSMLGESAPAVADDRISLPVDPRLIKTESADFIVNSVLPHVLAQFLAKNADYGDQHRTGLGLRAEFVGLHRKMAKLQKAIWDGEDMNHEGPEEMLTDLVGACLLMIDLIRQSEV